VKDDDAAFDRRLPFCPLFDRSSRETEDSTDSTQSSVVQSSIAAQGIVYPQGVDLDPPN
jgi:hypothetical protein